MGSLHYPGIDSESTRNSGTVISHDETGEEVKTSITPYVVLDHDSIICCHGDAYGTCYSADKSWVTTSKTRKEAGSDGNNVSYVAVEPDNSSSCRISSDPGCFDADDADASIHPAARDICDGVDNDGSSILFDKEAAICSDLCPKETDCIELRNEDGSFRANAHCDSTPDGSQSVEPWQDRFDGIQASYGQVCKKRHESNTVCNDKGKVACMAHPVLICEAGTKDCSCGIDSSKRAYRINEENTIVDLETGEAKQGEIKSDEYIYYAYLNSSNQWQARYCSCQFDEADEKCSELCNTYCHQNIDYGLSCIAPSNGEVDGLDENGNVQMNGKDDNCNGVVDEDGMLPCLIQINSDYENYKDGLEVSGSESVKYFTDADKGGYQLDAVKNRDGSINLCRLGVLSPNKYDDSTGVYSLKCSPIFTPRKYDFYGDGIDSNCDGADYDLEHTLFVASKEQGEAYGSKTNNCKFDGTAVRPCIEINDALNKSKDETFEFYHDVLITSGSYERTDSIQIPTLSRNEQLQAIYELSTGDLSDISGEIESGHILTPYQFHKVIIKKRINSSKFDVNKIKYLIYKSTTKKILVEGKEMEIPTYEPLIDEVTQPKESVRLFGGFSHQINNHADVLAEKDFWTVDDKSKSTITRSFVPPEDDGESVSPSYALIEPASSNGRLSIRLDNLSLNMQSQTSVQSQALADGVTFVGIDASNGASVITLNNVELNVRGDTLPGYSYFDEVPSITAAAEFVAERNEYDSQSIDNKYISEHYNSNDCVSKTGSYDSRYPLCGQGLEDHVIKPSYGGCGGFSMSYYPENEYSEDASYLRDRYGRDADGYPYDKYAYGKDGVSRDGLTAEPGRNTSKSLMKSGGVDDECEAVSQAFRGAPGKGGIAGENGDQSKIEMSYQVDSASGKIYVKSDRTMARGLYGQPGGGGAGGSVERCWAASLSDDTWCYAGGGGVGGCGGRGGEAGGTGTSAIGILINSNSVTRQTTLNLNNSMVSAFSGNGGVAQRGSQGAYGGAGGNSLSYARERTFLGKDVQAQTIGNGGGGGGGGAGGTGAGGKAGWVYPFLFACSVPGITQEMFNNDKLLTLKNCGFELPTQLIETPSTYGTQNRTGKTISKTPSASDANSGQDGMSVRDDQVSMGGSFDACSDSQQYLGCAGGMGGTAVDPSQELEDDFSCTKDHDGKTNLYIDTFIISK